MHAYRSVLLHLLLITSLCGCAITRSPQWRPVSSLGTLDSEVLVPGPCNMAGPRRRLEGSTDGIRLSFIPRSDSAAIVFLVPHGRSLVLTQPQVTTAYKRADGSEFESTASLSTGFPHAPIRTPYAAPARTDGKSPFQLAISWKTEVAATAMTVRLAGVVIDGAQAPTLEFSSVRETIIGFENMLSCDSAIHWVQQSRPL